MNKLILLLLSLFFTFNANAKSSFRLDNGKLLSVGQSKSEIIALAGVPIYQDVESEAIDNGQQTKPVKRELWIYKLEGSIGGLYYVEVSIENNEVVLITSKQENRI